MEIKELGSLMTRTRIQILPMSSTEEFKEWDIEDLQEDFFKGRLKKRERETGKMFYNYDGQGIALPDGEKALILFQFRAKIIACGVLDKVIKDVWEKKGRYFFSKGTIKTFTPITSEDLEEVFSRKVTFGQSKTLLDIDKLDGLLELIEEKSN